MRVKRCNIYVIARRNSADPLATIDFSTSLDIPRKQFSAYIHIYRSELDVIYQVYIWTERNYLSNLLPLLDTLIEKITALLSLICENNLSKLQLLRK